MTRPNQIEGRERHERLYRCGTDYDAERRPSPMPPPPAPPRPGPGPSRSASTTPTRPAPSPATEPPPPSVLIYRDRTATDPHREQRDGGYRPLHRRRRQPPGPAAPSGIHHNHPVREHHRRDLGITIQDNTAKLSPSTTPTATPSPPSLCPPAETRPRHQCPRPPTTNTATKPTNPVPTGTTTTYAWHGADQQALDSSGLILMGAASTTAPTACSPPATPSPAAERRRLSYPQDPINEDDTRPAYRQW